MTTMRTNVTTKVQTESQAGDHFFDYGYEIVRGLIPLEVLETIKAFMELKRDETLATVQSEIPYGSVDELIQKAQSYYQKPENFKQLAHGTQMALSGHFDLETRLDETFRRIPQLPPVQRLMKKLLATQTLSVHLPPTARFVLPGNSVAAVPAHQDVSYNKHLKDFIVMWVPFVDIDEDCGGVIVHHGTGQMSEQMVTNGTFWLNRVKGSEDKRHCSMQRGDVLLLNKWVVHESCPNVSNRTRYSTDFRFFDRQFPSLKHSLNLNTGAVVDPPDQG